MSAENERRHPEGLVLRAVLHRQTPRPIDIARTAGFSRQYATDVLSGRKRASRRFIDACRDLGLPVDVIWRSEP
jgi:hypothetical protein